MNNDEFVKRIKEIGKIKDIREAFEKYPVEEEEHKGKIESYIAVAEEGEKYYYKSGYKVGDIIYVTEYFYKNGERGTNHLFVIIGKDNFAVPIEYFGMLISSKTYKIKYDTNELLEKDSINKLNKDSIVKLDEVYRIKEEAISFKIGKVDEDKIEDYKKRYLEINE